MKEQNEWAADHGGHWTFKDASIEPDGERFILNMAGMLVTSFESVEEAKQYHFDNFQIKPREVGTYFKNDFK